MTRRQRAILSCVLLLVGLLPPAMHAQQPGGRIVGQLVDRSTGRPIPQARVTIDGRAGGLTTDMDGRYRSPELPGGWFTVRAASLGYRPLRRDSVRVEGGRATTADFALEPAPLELEELTVVAAAPPAARTDAGLLAIQQAAPTVMDGVSAEAMARSPDSDAGQAIARVTGVSVVDEKFVVVRGLGERYGNTLLNGVELPSPEPTKRIVPLDLFPSSLLESIVTVKAGRPDIPGDFTGASVQVETKQFPDNPVREVKVDFGYNSLATFEDVQLGAAEPGDRVASGQEARLPAAPFPLGAEGQGIEGERFLEQVRNVWTPSGMASPEIGIGLTFGQLLSPDRTPIGVIASLTYDAETLHHPTRVYQVANAADVPEPTKGQTYRETARTVEWGGLLNLSVRLGDASTISLKNFLSRDAEQAFLEYRGFNQENIQEDNIHAYQARYLERTLLQSQLAGEHLIRPLLGSRLEWKGSWARATRDEPENRSLIYRDIAPTDGQEEFAADQANNFFYFRFLEDRIWTAQADWSLPVSLRTTRDAEIKVGGGGRWRARDFDAYSYRLEVNPVATGDPSLVYLPPEELFQPEILGDVLGLNDLIERVEPGDPFPANPQVVNPAYESDDDVVSAYGMLDLPVVPAVRLVGGLRMEQWRLDLFPNSQDDPQGAPILRRETDLLWSANATWSLSERMNLRAASWRSVARPEPLELVPALYVPVTGECGTVGNPDLERTLVTNADVRWELFPGPGELLSVSGFYKWFTDPIFERVGFPNLNNCQIFFENASSGRTSGLEFEARKSLGFIAPALQPLSLSFNLTLTSTSSTDSTVGTTGVLVRERDFIGQSPWVVNLAASWQRPESGFSATVLFNRFDDRIKRYGSQTETSEGFVIVPDVVERGRSLLDFRVSQRLGGVALSLSGRNLLGAETLFVQETVGGEFVAESYHTGRTFTFGITYGW